MRTGGPSYVVAVDVLEWECHSPDHDDAGVLVLDALAASPAANNTVTVVMGDVSMRAFLRSVLVIVA